MDGGRSTEPGNCIQALARPVPKFQGRKEGGSALLNRGGNAAASKMQDASLESRSRWFKPDPAKFKHDHHALAHSISREWRHPDELHAGCLLLSPALLGLLVHPGAVQFHHTRRMRQR